LTAAATAGFITLTILMFVMARRYIGTPPAVKA
jgi:hypothetical protein